MDEDGLRGISRKVGVDRKTVRRLIQAFEERLSSDVLKVALHSQRVIYLRLACSGGPFFKSKMGEHKGSSEMNCLLCNMLILSILSESKVQRSSLGNTKKRW